MMLRMTTTLPMMTTNRKTGSAATMKLVQPVQIAQPREPPPPLPGFTCGDGGVGNGGGGNGGSGVGGDGVGDSGGGERWRWRRRRSGDAVFQSGVDCIPSPHSTTLPLIHAPYVHSIPNLRHREQGSTPFAAIAHFFLAAGGR